MKVLHYIPSIAQDQGGVAAYLSILSEELGKRCELVIATCVQNGNLPMKNCKVADLTGFTFTDAGLKPSWSGIHRFLKLCDSILDAERPDIVHINGIWTIDRWLMQRQAIKRNIPTYVMPHGMLEPWILRRHYWTKKFPALMLYEKKALRSAKCLIATAESEKQNLLKLKMNNADIPVIANGIDVKDCSGGDKLAANDTVRIFPIEKVKGMEFEVVFFYDIDKIKNLVERYLYVGLSRATFYLGVTSNPLESDILIQIQKQFNRRGNWKTLVGEDEYNQSKPGRIIEHKNLFGHNSYVVEQPDLFHDEPR